MKECTLLIDAKDQKGLVYKVSKVIYDFDLNIEHNAEYVDEEAKKFFMRTVVRGHFNAKELQKSVEKAIEDANVRVVENKTKDIVILATKESHVLGDLLIKYFDGELDANIKAVIANHNDLKDLVEKFGIPFHHIDATGLEREKHEKLMVEQIKAYDPDIIVLAKYMRILTPNFVKEFPQKVLNIHHSFLPAFIGANPYKQAYERGVKIIGATAHFVTNDLDEGPIIAQNIVRVDHSYSWQEMRRDGRNVEKVVLSTALQLLLEERVFVHQNKTIIL
jgi:formyltetrahydrofolate deformylase